MGKKGDIEREIDKRKREYKYGVEETSTEITKRKEKRGRQN